jgi:hypothetical protein
VLKPRSNVEVGAAVDALGTHVLFDFLPVTDVNHTFERFGRITRGLFVGTVFHKDTNSEYEKHSDWKQHVFSHRTFLFSFLLELRKEKTRREKMAAETKAMSPVSPTAIDAQELQWIQLLQDEFSRVVLKQEEDIVLRRAEAFLDSTPQSHDDRVVCVTATWLIVKDSPLSSCKTTNKTLATRIANEWTALSLAVQAAFPGWFHQSSRSQFLTLSIRQLSTNANPFVHFRPKNKMPFLGYDPDLPGMLPPHTQPVDHSFDVRAFSDALYISHEQTSADLIAHLNECVRVSARHMIQLAETPYISNVSKDMHDECARAMPDVNLWSRIVFPLFDDVKRDISEWDDCKPSSDFLQSKRVPHFSNRNAKAQNSAQGVMLDGIKLDYTMQFDSLFRLVKDMATCVVNVRHAKHETELRDAFARVQADVGRLAHAGGVCGIELHADFPGRDLGQCVSELQVMRLDLEQRIEDTLLALCVTSKLSVDAIVGKLEYSLHHVPLPDVSFKLDMDLRPFRELIRHEVVNPSLKAKLASSVNPMDTVKLSLKGPLFRDQSKRLQDVVRQVRNVATTYGITQTDMPVLNTNDLPSYVESLLSTVPFVIRNLQLIRIYSG